MSVWRILRQVWGYLTKFQDDTIWETRTLSRHHPVILCWKGVLSQMVSSWNLIESLHPTPNTKHLVRTSTTISDCSHCFSFLRTHPHHQRVLHLSHRFSHLEYPCLTRHPLSPFLSFKHKLLHVDLHNIFSCRVMQNRAMKSLQGNNPPFFCALELTLLLITLV